MEDELTKMVIQYFIEKDMRTDSRNEIRHKEYTEIIERVGTKVLSVALPLLAGKLFDLGAQDREKDGAVPRTMVNPVPGWDVVKNNPNPDPEIDKRLNEVGELVKSFLKMNEEKK